MNTLKAAILSEETSRTLTAAGGSVASRDMANVLKDEKKQQIIALGRLGWSLRKIQETTRVRRETISAYLRGAGVEIWPPERGKREGKEKPAIPVITGSEAAKPAIPEAGGHANFNLNPNPENLSTKGKATSKPAIEVITDFGVGLSGQDPETSKGVGSASTCEPYREIIQLGLSRDRNAMAIWQDLVSDFGFQGGYQSVRRFAYKLRGTQVPQARAVILTAPGEEGQVDYGSGPMVREAPNSKYRRTRLFVLTLGYSRKAVRLLTFRSSTRIWAELHEKAFRRLGGVPRILVLDNLRGGVPGRDVYDAQLNPLYRDVLSHYGAVALPCRIQDPDRKGKVESAVGHAKNTPLKGQRFESLEEAQAYLDRWETNWADTRIHGTTKRQVAAMFAEEKPTLLPLPVEPFRYYQYGERIVHLDGCVEVEAAYYGAPPGWIGRHVQVQWDARHVRLLDPRTGILLREHLSGKRGGHRIRDADRARRTPPQLLQLLARAHKAGANIGAICDAIHARQGELGVR